MATISTRGFFNADGFQKVWKDERAVTAIKYGLLIIGVITALRTSLSATFTSVANNLRRDISGPIIAVGASGRLCGDFLQLVLLFIASIVLTFGAA